MIRPCSGESSRYQFADSSRAWDTQATLAECLVIHATTKNGRESMRAWWQPGRSRRAIDNCRDVRGTRSGALTGDAYGRLGIMNTNGTVSYSPSDFGNFVGFTGRYHDWETGLVYFRARYYDTGLGRFIGRDPAGYVDGKGLYGAYYVPNNTDPTGKMVPITTSFVVKKISGWRAWLDKNGNPASAAGVTESVLDLKVTGVKNASIGCCSDITISNVTLVSTISIPDIGEYIFRQTPYGLAAHGKVDSGIQAKILAHEMGHKVLSQILAEHLAKALSPTRTCCDSWGTASNSSSQNKADTIRSNIIAEWFKMSAVQNNALHSALRSDGQVDPTESGTSVEGINAATSEALPAVSDYLMKDWACP